MGPDFGVSVLSWGLSQTPIQAAQWIALTLVLRVDNLRKSEAKCEQPVLLAYRPGACKAEPLPQPQHGFSPPDCSSCRAEGLKAADPQHGPFDP